MPDEANAVGALFGKTPAPAAPEDGSAPEPEGAPGKPEWLPDAFWTKSEAGGQINVEAMAKSWRDTRGSLNAANERVKALEGQGRDEVPTEADGYWGGMDADALAQAAPKAFSAGGGADGVGVKNLMRAMHANGVGPERARAVLRGYYEGMEEALPAELGMSDDDARKAAIGHQGPNGQRIADDVETWLTSRHEAQPFPDEQMEVMGQMVRSGPGLGLLYNLMRQTADSGPPVGRHTVQVDRAARADELKKLMADPANWNSKDGRARIEALFDEVNPHLKGK